MKIYLPFHQFVLLALSTAFATYFFNDAILAGSYFLALFWGAILVRNLRVSYQLSKLVRTLEAQIEQIKKKRE